jgi:SpoVK/Ycf46/Vps4 family AAA+-type ATPase
MSIERIRQIFKKQTGQRFFILYGEGVEDTFITEDLRELSIEQALLDQLKEIGYRRVVFYAPHRSIFYLDEDSRSLSTPAGQEIGNQDVGERQMHVLQDGPLQGRVMINHVGANTPANPQRGMGDLHAIRLLDTIMRDNNRILTAVVFLQAETSLRFFEDQRTLAGIVGEWARLPARNNNSAFFIFSTNRYEELCQVANQISLPEIKSTILRQKMANKGEGILYQLVGPEQGEMSRLIKYLVNNMGLRTNETNIEKFSLWMSAEGGTGRLWYSRLAAIPILDIKIAREYKWFSAFQDMEMNAEEKMAGITGLSKIKNRILDLSAWAKLRYSQSRAGKVHQEPPNLHLLFSGNPGTGKTTIARLIGELYHEIGILQRGHLVEVKAADLVADHIGGTAIKTNSLIDQAIDGVLFIDEAYALTEKERGGFGQEAIETLLMRMETDRDRLVVIVAGYPEKMHHFRSSNPGLARRFPEENCFYFEDYSSDELKAILENMLSTRNFGVDHRSSEILDHIIGEWAMRKDPTFGNAGEVRNLVDSLEQRYSARIVNQNQDDDRIIHLEDFPDKYLRLLTDNSANLEDIFSDLNRLVGLTTIKNFINSQVKKIRLSQLRHQLDPEIQFSTDLQHMIFCGNPGTGKTTVARLIGKIYRSLGLLSQGNCVEVSRSDLVAGYVGQTALKTTAKITSAIGGVLFIDEAYTLSREGQQDFGQEAIDTLVKALDDYRGRFLVVIAGYPAEINHFMAANPGLASRFANPIIFPDFSSQELIEILQRLAYKEKFILTPDVKNKAGEWLAWARQVNPRNFGNARAVLNLYETMKGFLAERVIQEWDNINLESANTFNPEDVPDAGFTINLDNFEPDLITKDESQLANRFYK